MENQVTVVVSSDGRIIHTEQQGVFRRSNKQNRLVALLDYPQLSVVKVNFRRADGVKPNSQYMTYTGEQTYEGESYRAYEYLLTDYQLNATGQLVVSLDVMYDDVTATVGDFTIDVEASEAGKDDVAPSDPNQYDEALQGLIRTDSKLIDLTANVPNLVASIQKVKGASNAFTYTDNSGVESAPIVIGGGADVPVSQSTASTVSIPASAWQPVYAADGTTVTGYTYTITASMHGQMRDQTQAKNLWVSFDEVAGTEYNPDYTGVFAEYKVNNVGDMTTSVSQPVAMPVRVWNGKGLRGETGNNGQDGASIVGVRTIGSEVIAPGTQTRTYLVPVIKQGAQTWDGEQFYVTVKNGEEGNGISYIQQGRTETEGLMTRTYFTVVYTKSAREEFYVDAAMGTPGRDGRNGRGVMNLRVTGVSESDGYTVNTVRQDFTDGSHYDMEIKAKNGEDVEARAAIAAETKRAEEAEQNLQQQVDVANSDIAGLREDITNESHLRGMFDSVEALRAKYPTATPNDYAYIVGGNQWIYEDGAWTDSGEPSPNTSVPKGTSIPLMDGVGSAGESNNYAPIDHRHPADTNKVNKAGDTMTGMLEITGTNPGGWSLKASGNVGGDRLYEGDVRVYSPNNPPPNMVKETVIDITAQDQETWYPILIRLPVDKMSFIRITATLSNSGKPSWSTHNEGFWCLAEWYSIGSGWEQTQVMRNILTYEWRYADAPFGRFGQQNNSSHEFIFVRGGGRYHVYTEEESSAPFVVLDSYTENDQTITPTKTPNTLAYRSGTNQIFNAAEVWDDGSRVYSPNNPQKSLPSVNDNVSLQYNGFWTSSSEPPYVMVGDSGSPLPMKYMHINSNFYTAQRPFGGKRISGTVSSSGGQITNPTNAVMIVTIWATETSQYGTLEIRDANLGTRAAYVEGEHAYWGANTLCITAVIQGGHNAIAKGSKVGTINYSAVCLSYN